MLSPGFQLSAVSPKFVNLLPKFSCPGSPFQQDELKADS
jgi:hypothetical protein